MEKTNTEVDFLLEMEYRLQGELNRVHERLEELLGKVSVEPVVERHLMLVPDLPDGAA